MLMESTMRDFKKKKKELHKGLFNLLLTWLLLLEGFSFEETQAGAWKPKS